MKKKLEEKGKEKQDEKDGVVLKQSKRCND